jgi:hypothetical protein
MAKRSESRGETVSSLAGAAQVAELQHDDGEDEGERHRVGPE